MKRVNFDWFKNKKILLATLGTCITVGLTGCLGDINKSYSNSDKEEINYEYVDVNKYPMEIYNINATKDILDNESIIFRGSDNKIYRSIYLNYNSVTHAHISGNGETIISKYLNQEIALPDTDENHKIILNIDYYKKTMTTEVVSLQKTNK